MAKTPKQVGAVETDVKIDLAGGPLCGQLIIAPRDSYGRIWADIAVQPGKDGCRTQAMAPGTAIPADFAWYRFESWTGAHPVYRFAG